MKATVLVDNLSQKEIQGEWGLSIFIECGKTTILLDTGASGLFLKNAKKLKKEIEHVDYAVLSHAHYDHSKGMREFFEENEIAKFYLRDGSSENCYLKKWVFHKYIGLPKNILEEFSERIVFVKGDYEIYPGTFLIPHKTLGLSEVGKKNNMYIRNSKTWEPDDFSHEQSLVLDTEDGLIIFNSCSHGGADAIINEVMSTFPDKKVKALIGGFHLFGKSEAEVRALANRIYETGIKEIYTGHCTGEKSYRILKDVLQDKLHKLHVGLVIE